MKPFSLSAKMLVMDDEGRFLLLRRSDCDWNPGKWDLPGGKTDAGETFEHALKREVFEETGLDVIIQDVFGMARDETTKHRLIHLVMTGRVVSGKVRLSDEHDQHAWVRPDDVSSMDLCGYLANLLQSR